MAELRHGLFWPKAGTAPEPLPDRRRPSPLLVALVGLVIALLVVSVLSVIYAIRVEQRLIALEDYVAGRGEFRDREAVELEERLRESFRRGICDTLDQLPEGGPLDRPRTKYECGPGVPLALLTPEERARLSPEERAPLVAPGPPVPELPPPLSGGAVRTKPREEPPAPARPVSPLPGGAQPSEPPGPLVDPGPVIDPLCDALPVCN